MPRFYFHLHDGTTQTDRVGVELRDVDAARKHATVYLGDILRDGGDTIWNGEDWQLSVTDQAGMVFLTVHIIAVQSAATKNVSKPR